MRLIVSLLLISYMGCAKADSQTSYPWESPSKRISFHDLASGSKTFEGLKKGDWVKISLNSNWEKRQMRNRLIEAGGTGALPSYPSTALHTKIYWGFVNHKTKDYLILQIKYYLRKKKISKYIYVEPNPLDFEKQSTEELKQINTTEIESISAWTDNENPALPSVISK